MSGWGEYGTTPFIFNQLCDKSEWGVNGVIKTKKKETSSISNSPGDHTAQGSICHKVRTKYWNHSSSNQLQMRILRVEFR